MAVYLVTGANGGMGAAIVRALLQKGHEVFGLDRSFGTCPEGLRAIPCDVTRPEEIEKAAAEVRERTESLDGIIHTAGVYDLHSLLEIPEEDFLRDFNVNLFGAYRVNRSFAGLLQAGSRIVMISSELAPLYPLPFTGIYAITKSAVEKYAESLRMEVQLLGIRVAVVRPGAVRTAMLPASGQKLDSFLKTTKLYPVHAARFRKIVGRVEAKNVPPERIAKTVDRALTARRPRLTYKVNRNPLLLLLNALPKRLQLYAIRKVIG